MQFWIIQGLNSLSLGGLLFLLSSGFSLIFGLMRLANLTHGAFFMLGTYLAAIALRSYDGLNIWVTALGAGLTVAAIGGLFERLVSGTAENQSTRAGAGDTRHVLHHFGCMPDVVGRRFHSRPDAAKTFRRRHAGLGLCFRPTVWCWSDAPSPSPLYFIFSLSGPGSGR